MTSSGAGGAGGAGGSARGPLVRTLAAEVAQLKRDAASAERRRLQDGKRLRRLIKAERSERIAVQEQMRSLEAIQEGVSTPEWWARKRADGRSAAACDGGGGPLGHPNVYLKIGDTGEVVCPYCSAQFILSDDAEEVAGH